MPSLLDFEVAGSSIVCLIICFEGIKLLSTRDGCFFMFKCGNTQKGPIPLFSILVRCSVYEHSYSLRVEVLRILRILKLRHILRMMLNRCEDCCERLLFNKHGMDSLEY